MTETLCFVLDGTLVQRTRSDAAVLEAVFEQHGIEASERLLTAATDEFRRAFAAMEPEPYRQSMAAVLGESGTETESDPDAMVETLRAETYAATAVSDAARESLAGLAEDSQLAVVADGSRAWQAGTLARHHLDGQFGAGVTSYEVGAHLPDAALFERVREQLPADEFVAVGDEDDIAGARAAGFVPIHYERGGPDLWAAVDALL